MNFYSKIIKKFKKTDSTQPTDILIVDTEHGVRGILVSDFMGGVEGTPGQKGEKGDKGDRGNGWFFGAEAPSPEVGVNGDLYYKTDTYEVYKKAEGNWSSIGVIKAKIVDATTSQKGVVKQSEKVTAISTPNATTAKDVYTQADIEGMVTLINKNKETINGILTALTNAGIMKA